MSKNREKIKSLFISDCHLGSRYSRASNLLELLKRYDPDQLFLVGDIIDGWKMSKKIYWNDTYSFIIRRIIGMIKDGTKVFYIAGNHDEFLRSFLPGNFGHIEILDEYTYDSINGQKILIIHGDIFDAYTLKYKWLYWLGDNAYSFSMWINSLYNYIRRRLGLKYWSLSQMLKRNTKKAINFINNFEYFIVKYTKEKKCSSVICGHIHHPELRDIEGIKYYNCGDWIESCSAIIEDLNGDFILITNFNN